MSSHVAAIAGSATTADGGQAQACLGGLSSTALTAGDCRILGSPAALITSSRAWHKYRRARARWLELGTLVAA